MDSLTTSLQGLVSEVKKTLESLDRVWDSAILHRNFREWYRREILQLEHRLGIHWTEIQDVLRKTYHHTEDLALLGRTKELHQDHILFVQEQMEKIADVEKRWHDSIPRNDEIWRDFEISISRLTSQNQRNIDSATLPSDLLISVASALESIQNTKVHLATLSQCWDGVRSICDTIADGSPQTPRQFDERCMNYLSSWKTNRKYFLDAVFPLSLSIDDISNLTRRHSSNSSPTSSNVAKAPTVSSPWFSHLTRGLNANLKSSNRTRIKRLLPSSESPSPVTAASGPKARGNKDGRLLDDGNTGPVHAPRQMQEDVHGENSAGNSISSVGAPDVATSIPRSPVTRLETKSVANPASVEQVDAPANTVTPTPTAISTTATTSTSTITTCGATSISATQPAPVSRPVFVLSDSVGSNWIAPEAPNSGPKPPTPNQPRSCDDPNMNSMGDPSAMNADVPTSDHSFEMAYKILSILSSEYWKNPCYDLEAVAIIEHLQGLTIQLIITFSEGKQSASTGETICQNMVAICQRMLVDAQVTRAEINDEISRNTGQLAAEAKRLKEKFQDAQMMVDCILTVLPAPSIAATAESVSITQVLEQVKDSSFEGAQAFFSRVAKDLTELKHYLREMKSIWVHLHQQVTTMAEKAPVEDLEVACKKIQVFYQDYSSRIKSLVNVTFLSDQFPEIEKEKDDVDQQFEAILPSFHISLAREMKTVFERACQCVAILELWNQATSRHPLANDIIERTQADFAVFFDLLSTSRDVAQKGIKLMQNVSYLCGNLLEPMKDPIHLKKFIEEVMPEVQEAQHKSINVKTNFRMIMVTFTGISKDIPTTVKKIEEEQRKEVARIESRMIPLQMGSIISLPFPLSLVVRVIEARRAEEIEMRLSRVRNTKAALIMLRDIGVFSSEIEHGLANFMNLWTSVSVSLEAIKQRIHEMQLYPETWAFRLELAKRQWEETAAVYHHYVLQVEYMCQLVPPLKATTTTNSKSGISGFFKKL